MNFNSLISIAATYPGFQSLPRGVKQMLLVSESQFFEEARTPQDLHSAQHEHNVHGHARGLGPEIHDLAHLAHAAGQYQASQPTVRVQADH